MNIGGSLLRELGDDEKVNILVVDDLPDRLLVFQSVLETLGQRIVTARSGEEALKLLLAHEFAVVLLDVNMPGLDGFETAELIRSRKRLAHVPIIFITAYADEVQTQRGYSLGAVDYILTPMVPEILRTKVSVFVELSRMQQQIRKQAEERVELAREQVQRTAAEEASQRSAFLAEAARRLSNSLDFDACLSNLSQCAVPFLSDLSLACFRKDEDEAWSIFGTLQLVDGGQRLFRIPSPPPTLKEAVDAVYNGALASKHDNIRFEPADFGREELLAERLELSSLLLIPLRNRHRTLGVLVLGRREKSRKDGILDRLLADDLADRGAVALENAMLYGDIRDRDRRKNEFLAMLAHELRNPLAPIRSAISVLKRLRIDDPQVQWSADVVDRQVNHLVHLVDDLLDVSRITRGQIELKQEEVEAGQVVRSALETCRPFIDSQEHKVELSLPSGEIWLNGDSTRLTQIIVNLLNNAAKYTERGGVITVSLEHEEGQAVFRVKDSGVGISPTMISKVFELFTQVDRSLDRSQGGLGIGLTVVKRLVEMHGGTVRAYSSGANSGSEFVVSLPAVVKTSAGDHTDGSEQKSTPSIRRVLVVDDNVDAADSLSMLLRLDGHEVSLAHDGLAALEEAQKFGPDVVLLDIGLPGMDGFAVARALREDPVLSAVRLIAVSGYGQKEDQMKTKDAGFDYHLIKPVDFDSLSALLG